jgi:hypothetical protein
VGVNEGNESYKSLITLKQVSHVDLTLLTFASFINVHASYRIGPNAVDLEGMPSFTEANSFPSFRSTKHHPSIGLFALKYLLYILDCALKYKSLMKS